MPRLSFVVVAYQAERCLPALLSDLNAQDCDHGEVEVILVDSASGDGTRALMEQFAGTCDFARVAVLDNPGRTLPCGWNVALRECRGDVIVRLDAHARMGADFLRCVLQNIDSGEKIVGGQRITVFAKDTLWQKVLAHAERSIFGSGVADYRRAGGRRYVKTLAHAAYSREAFDAAGPYDERLVRTEDNDMHYRMRRCGYRFCLCPDIVSWHAARSSLRAMLRQKLLNGLWVGRTLGVQPRCLSLYHLVPAVFVLALLGCGALSLLLHSILPIALLLVAYFAAALLAMIKEMLGEKQPGVLAALFCLPVLFFLLHLAYGIGTLAGACSLPIWLPKRRNRPEPQNGADAH